MSYTFDGVDDRLTNSPGVLGGTQLTGFITMQPTSYGENSRAHFITQGTGADASGPRMNFQFGDGFGGVYPNTIHLVVDRATSPGRWSTPYDPAQFGKWQSAAFSIDSSSTANDPTMYFNGQPTAVTRRTTPSGAVNADPGVFYVGNASGLTRTFVGMMTTVAVWTRVLDASEHALIHYCGVRKVLRGLQFWYRGLGVLSATGPDWTGLGRSATVTVTAMSSDASGDRLAAS